jgi:hypothetical protein
MILDEVRGGTHAIDFLNPRQEPKPPNRNRLYAGIAAAVLVVASAGGFYVWDRIETVKEENSVVYAEMRELEKLVQSGKTKERMVTAVREWQAADICWLDELRDLALRLPSSRDMVLHKMTLAPARGGGGSVSYFGQVRDPSIVLRMENAVRDSFHAIESRRVQERQGEKDYTWRFETSMTVARRAAEEYTSHLPKRPEEDSRTALNPSTDEAKPSAGARSEESSKRPAGEEVSASQSATTLNPPGGAAQSPPTTRAGVLGAGFKTPRASDKRSAPAGGTQPREAPGEVDVENTPQTSDEQAGGPGEAALSRATETSK